MKPKCLKSQLLILQKYSVDPLFGRLTEDVWQRKYGNKNKSYIKCSFDSILIFKYHPSFEVIMSVNVMFVREAAKKKFAFSGQALTTPLPLLVAGPLKKTFFAASLRV